MEPTVWFGGELSGGCAVVGTTIPGHPWLVQALLPNLRCGVDVAVVREQHAPVGRVGHVGARVPGHRDLLAGAAVVEVDVRVGRVRVEPEVDRAVRAERDPLELHFVLLVLVAVGTIVPD